MTRPLHEQRLQSIEKIVHALQPRSILDLGCGPGPLLLRLASNAVHNRIVGVDSAREPLDRLRAALPVNPGAQTPNVEIIETAISDLDHGYKGFDLALLIETIEHMTAGALKATSSAVFGKLGPRHAIVTTPNIEFNHLLGVPARRFRHPGHRFEWTRPEFRAWCDAVADDFAYSVACIDICGAHSQYGGATQLARFTHR